MSQRVKGVAILLAVVAFFVVLLLPKILHGLDRGEERVPVAQLAAGYHPQSRNLIVEGMLDGGHVVDRIVTDENGHTKERLSYLPLVPAGWSRKDPVHVVYAVKAWADFLKPHLAASEHRGVLRDILWESTRLSSKVKDELARMGVTVAEDARLVESDDPPPQ